MEGDPKINVAWIITRKLSEKTLRLKDCSVAYRKYIVSLFYASLLISKII